MKKFFLIMVAAFFLVNAAWVANVYGAAYIEAEGIVYYEEGMNLNQMRRIAIMDAYRYLAEQVDTLHITSESSVKNLRELDETINAKVTAALRGAKVTSVNREVDGSFHAIVRLPLYGSGQSLAAAVLKENTVVEDYPKPKFTNIRSEINYTGLIIDCRGLKLEQAITPLIKSNDGTEIYAYKNVGYQATVESGMVEYSSSMDSPRAGEMPLIVKALKISGSCDVIISSENADKILAANSSAKFLEHRLVVLVGDEL